MVKLTRDSYIKIALIALLCMVICAALGRCATAAVDMTAAYTSRTFPSAPDAPDAPDAPEAPDAPAAPDAPDAPEPPDAFESSLTEIGSHEVDPAEVRNLSIQWAAGQVAVQTAPDGECGGKIQVRERASGSAKRVRPLSMEVSGETLCINSNEAVWSFWQGCSSFASKRLEVTIPESAAGNLGTVEVDGASGMYWLAGFSCDKLDIALASGMLDTVGITVRNLVADIASGQVSLEGAFPQAIDITAASGSITVTDTGSTFPQRIDADIMSGEVVLALAKECGFTADVDRLSGNFTCGYETSQRDGRYVHGDGASSVNINLTSGNVELKPQA